MQKGGRSGNRKQAPVLSQNGSSKEFWPHATKSASVPLLVKLRINCATITTKDSLEVGQASEGCRACGRGFKALGTLGVWGMIAPTMTVPWVLPPPSNSLY